MHQRDTETHNSSTPQTYVVANTHPQPRADSLSTADSRNHFRGLRAGRCLPMSLLTTSSEPLSCLCHDLLGFVRHRQAASAPLPGRVWDCWVIGYPRAALDLMCPPPSARANFSHKHQQNNEMLCHCALTARAS